MKRTRQILLLLFCIIAISYIFHLANTHKSVPFASSGNAVFFYEQGNKESHISEVDATENHIFFLFSSTGVVEAYDWDGEYQYSIAVYRNPTGHGSCNIRCEGGLLYIQDYDKNVIIVKDQTILEKIKSTESAYSTAWFNESSGQVAQSGDQLIDCQGNIIMVLPGIGKQALLWSNIFNVALMAITIVLSILLNREPNITGRSKKLQS